MMNTPIMIQVEFPDRFGNDGASLLNRMDLSG